MLVLGLPSGLVPRFRQGFYPNSSDLVTPSLCVIIVRINLILF